MKRALRVSVRSTSRRRRLRRRSVGFALTFAPIASIDSGILYTDSGVSGDARPYPDAQPDLQGTCTIESF